MYYSSSMGVGSYITLKVVLAVALLVTTVVPPPCEASTDRLISTILGSAADNDDENRGTIWAVLVAGSNGYENYRHQADICHAYQLLKDGGLKDENIIVFMYDDIAYNKENPRQGIIINHPNGSDVYSGVPKDYTGEEVNAQNFYQVLLGNKSGVVGGSGKVVKSKPNDVIFLYYADHGATGLLAMPTGPYVYADDLIKVLRKKHKAGTYKKMVIYVEACESGSMFEGLLGDDWNIYAMTASNAEESSYAWYCPGSYPPPPPEYETCLGDLFSIAWMEDSDSHNRKKERIKEQFKKVKERTKSSSHVKEYGSIKDIINDKLSDYQGYHHPSSHYPNHLRITNLTITVDQRDAELLYLWEKYKRLGEKNSEMKEKVLKEMAEKVQHRAHIDKSVGAIGDYVFGTHKSHSILKSVRKPGLPVVDNWECLKSMVKIFEEECGALGEYGKKHVRAFANICNHGISSAAMRKASITACAGRSKQ